MSPGRLWTLIAVTMTAFAANSLLNRAAVGSGDIDALSFAIIRVLAGAVMLSVLVVLSGRRPVLPPAIRLASAAGLALYLLGFSIAYAHLDAGLGAMILFGGVQLTMFGVGVFAGEAIPARRWIGAGLAFAGLALLSWPTGQAAAAPLGVIMMVLAALGWGAFSLLGRGAKDPLPETAASFLLAIPMIWLPIYAFSPVSPEGMPPIMPMGIALAIVSGAVTSGLGYAIWYAVLPRITASTAALVQLSAPLLAVLGGIVLLGEAAGWRLGLATLLILGGIAFGLGVGQRKIGSSGS